MGKISILTAEQKECLDQIRKNKYICENFYFTGGTALSEYYLHHRYSDDIDLFTDVKYDHQIILGFIKELSKNLKINYKVKRTEIVDMYFLEYSPVNILKIDFVYSSDQRLKISSKDKGLFIDSFMDIAVNKITAINDRLSVKDFVDYYYISQHYTVWDLIEGARKKCRMDIDPWSLSTDFLSVEKFDSMPRMIKPLTLEELKIFYRQKAKEIGMRQVEK